MSHRETVRYIEDLQSDIRARDDVTSTPLCGNDSKLTHSPVLMASMHLKDWHSR
jgi:hypothetical protein